LIAFSSYQCMNDDRSFAVENTPLQHILSGICLIAIHKITSPMAKSPAAGVYPHDISHEVGKYIHVTDVACFAVLVIAVITLATSASLITSILILGSNCLFPSKISYPFGSTKRKDDAKYYNATLVLVIIDIFRTEGVNNLKQFCYVFCETLLEGGRVR